MNFDYSEDELALKETMRRLLASRADLKVVRRVLDGDRTVAPALWAELGADGWLSASLPAESGGQAMGEVALCGIAEEMGRALAPLPLGSITIVAAAIAASGSPAQKQTLPALARGEQIAAFAVAEAPGPLTPQAVLTEFASGTLSGRKIAVVDGLDASVALVAARSGGELGLFLVELDGPGVSRQAQRSVDPTKPLADLRFDRAPAEPLGNGADWAAIEKLLDRAAVLMAFEQLGGADVALEMARQYTLERHAFGRPIGSFQAVKHKLADVYMANELARSNAYYGAWALATDAPDLPLAAATARVAATDAFELAARELIQVHGGIAITWEHDAQFFYRRSRHLALALGAPAQWRQRLVAQLAKAA
jgi:alkylation response protein AidB-like acyl-CoA dehydrogenase